MEFEIKTIDGEFIRLKEVLFIQLPTDKAPFFKLGSEKEEYTFPSHIVKYCKKITLIIGKRRSEDAK